MAELATIARPYAEALFKAVPADEAAQTGSQLDALAKVAGDARILAMAGSPKTTADQLFNVVSDVLGRSGVVLGAANQNLLKLLIANSRLPAVGEIAEQFRSLFNARSGVFDATIESAFPLEGQQLDELLHALEGRFKRKLKPTVVVKPELIGGVRVAVGDEVLDSSVAARLNQMKTALTA